MGAVEGVAEIPEVHGEGNVRHVVHLAPDVPRIVSTFTFDKTACQPSGGVSGDSAIPVPTQVEVTTLRFS